MAQITAGVAGDTDLEGDVDFTNFNTLANNYTGSLDPGVRGKDWSKGDFAGDVPLGKQGG